MAPALRSCPLPRSQHPFQPASQLKPSNSLGASFSCLQPLAPASSSTQACSSQLNASSQQPSCSYPVESSNSVSEIQVCATNSQQHGPQRKQATSSSSRRDALLLLSPIVVSQVFGLASNAFQSIAHAAPSEASISPASSSNRGMGRYIRKKKLDPLESYVPLVLQARDQLTLSRELARQDPQAGRALLRAGAFNGLRDNIRALGEYAVGNGVAKDASAQVTGFFRALEVYDLTLNQGKRDGTEKATEEQVDAAFVGADAAFEAVIATVPAQSLARAREVLVVAAAKEEAAKSMASTMASTEGGVGAAAPAPQSLRDADLDALLLR